MRDRMKSFLEMKKSILESFNKLQSFNDESSNKLKVMKRII